MKRSILFLISAMCFGHVVAQQTDDTFQFTDLNGNIVADGSVITVNTINEEGQMVVPLQVKNTSATKAAGSIYETISGMPGGAWQTCAFGNCMQLTENGYSPKSIVMGGIEQDIQTEWIPQEGQYASWTATLQIHVFNIVSVTMFGRTSDSVGSELIGYGPSVTVNFVYADPAAVNAITNATAPAQQLYSISGQHVANGYRGIAIVRTADGHTMKKIVR